MFYLVNTETLIALNNKLGEEIRELDAKKQQDYGDFFEDPDDYDDQDRKEYYALCKKITNKRDDHKKLMLHLSGLAEMISDYQKKQKQEKNKESD